jgi:hypothetical protein
MLEAGLLTGAGAGLGGVFGDEGGAMRGAGAGLGTALGTSAGATLGGALGGLGTYGVSRLAGNRSREALYHGLTGAGAGGLIGGIGGGVYGGIKGYQRVHNVQNKKKKGELEKKGVIGVGATLVPLVSAIEAGSGHRTEGALRGVLPGLGADIGGDIAEHYAKKALFREGLSDRQNALRALGVGLLEAGGAMGTAALGHGLTNLIAGEPSWHRHHHEKQSVYDHGQSASPAPTPHPAGTPGQMIGRPLPVKPPRPIGRPMQQPQMAAPNNVPKMAALRAFLS